MSAPTSGSADGSPAPGFYPDPSIPGYIRYWNGAAWVPGTSRPAPQDGEDMPGPPPGAAAASSAAPSPAGPAPRREETGPMFLDEAEADDEAAERGDSGRDASAGTDAGAGPRAGSGTALPELRPRGEMDVRPAAGIDWSDPSRLHGSRPEPASAWGADASRQSGFGSGQDRRVSWGNDPADAGPAGASSASGATDWAAGDSGRSARAGGAADPRASEGSGAAGAAASIGRGPGEGGGSPGTVDLGAGGSSADRDPGRDRGSDRDPGRGSGAGRGSGGRRDGTLTLRNDRGDDPGAAPSSGATSPGSKSPGAADGTMAIRAVRPGADEGERSVPAARDGESGPGRDGTMTIRAAGSGSVGAGSGSGSRADGTMAIRAVRPGASGPAAIPPQPGPAAPQPPQAQSPQPPTPQPPAPIPAPVTPGPGGGQPSWAQQAHQLPRSEGRAAAPEPVVPWRPPADDPFLQAAQAQAAARPASLGRRFAARLIDTALLGGAVGAAAVPLWTKAVDHVNDKIEQAKLSGETVTVWLLDSTTAAYLGIVLGVLLVGGVLYEALPTAKWGRTLGKRLCQVKVLDIESHDTAGFGAALRRWLLYSVLGVLLIGVLNVLWCLFDRPWRQCWHDKAARTFVAGTGGSAASG
ncbi:RDD family protein [Streptomyces sp. 8N616]|uniref:RDD family protein n=1 Tax=Streptomyces sp. 8N616 TaxID=3457414 RepID=UPI003FD3EAA8